MRTPSCAHHRCAGSLCSEYGGLAVTVDGMLRPDDGDRYGKYYTVEQQDNNTITFVVQQAAAAASLGALPSALEPFSRLGT